MYYTIYKITNKINNKFYIGMHKTKNLDDGYMGSGKLIKAAIQKHGIENFSKEILHVFDNEEDMKNKEKELVILSENCYNMCEGGKGGFSYINSNNLNNGRFFAKPIHERSVESQKKYFESMKTRNTIEYKQSISNGLKKYYTSAPGNFKGKKHTIETKDKIACKAKINSKGERNSQFNTMWITNGVLNKKIKKDDILPEGWKKGRITKLTT